MKKKHKVFWVGYAAAMSLTCYLQYVTGDGWGVSTIGGYVILAFSFLLVALAYARYFHKWWDDEIGDDS